ncbi:lysosome-associated membrane glycoprotein 1 [Ranitomeya imitator]|uniref:lysosome-associated membrane glycoprotein 1 n=1 Tax=Ranitomeya imitator TaxID=111125 RepID=UPI0037E91451
MTSLHRAQCELSASADAMTSSRMRRLGEAALGVALMFGIFQFGSCVHFDVKDEGTKTSCILADLSVNFTVDYKRGEKQGKSLFVLPDNALTDQASSCGKNGTLPLLVVAFGLGHSLSLQFNKSDAGYQVNNLTFSYNLTDPVLFPESSENDTKKVSSNKAEISAKTNWFYQCSNPHLVVMDNVNASFHHVKLQAYLTSNNYSTNATICKEDVAPTAAPTTAPTTAPPNNTKPDIGTYNINITGKAGYCLMAKMGLRLNITYIKKDNKATFYEFNIDPKKVIPSGNCSNDSATLILSSVQANISFNFVLNATEGKFYLGHVHVNTTVADAKESNFSIDSGNVSFLKTTAHKSYKCNEKQTLQITSNLSIYTYNLQVQPFDVEGDKFGPAVECAEDQNGMLVPIIVGAALAGLVLIVLIAYLIGRKRSHAGYQTI